MKGKKKFLVVLVAVVCMLALGATWALAQSLGNGTIYACVTSTGTPRIVATNPVDCRKGETPLSWNITGPQGPQGEQGPAGPQGPQGEQGQSATVTMVQFGSPVATTLTPTSEWLFLGTPVAVTVSSGQRVLVQANAALGSSSGAQELYLNVCYQSGGANIINRGPGLYQLNVGAGDRRIFGINGVLSDLSDGTYSVGMCYFTNSPNWNNNDYVIVTALVGNTAGGTPAQSGELPARRP